MSIQNWYALQEDWVKKMIDYRTKTHQWEKDGIHFEEIQQADVNEVYDMGYSVWGKGRTKEQYYLENQKEEVQGVRYGLKSHNGEIVSSLILLSFGQVRGYPVFGVGSIVTKREHQKKGFASLLLMQTVHHLEQRVKDAVIFGYSDIPVTFYLSKGFDLLPARLQRNEKVPCFVYGTAKQLAEIEKEWSVEDIPAYF